MEHPGSAGVSWLDLYVVKRLSAADEAAFEEHLLECASCRDEVRLAERLRRELRAVGRSLSFEAR